MFFYFQIDKQRVCCYTLNMKNSEKQLLKKRITRLGLFFLIVLVPIVVIEVVLASCGVKQWVNIMILVIIMFFLFAIYTIIYEKFDARKEERKKKKKDPFAD